MTTVGIDSRAGELMMLHASGLADPSTGRTAALVGRSGMGKTTATRTLGKEFGYITDETLAIDRAGNIVPYAKPLSVINTDPPAPKVQVGPDELGLLPAPSELKLAAVVLLDRNPLADEPRITPLTNADAIIELIPQTSSLARIRRPLQWLCSLLDACGGAVRITYRESEELLPILPGLLHRPAAPAQWFPAIEDNEIGSSKSESGTILRAEIIDAVELPKGNDETELLAMTGHHVLRLVGIAPAIWHATRIPATGIHDIAERIASVSNVPHGYQGTLSAAVQHLESHGILTRT